MVLRSKREFPPSEYEVNEEVIIKIQHGVLRARAVEHIVSNVDMFLEFIEDKNIEKNKFVASLSTDREQADNLAIQAEADAYGATLVIINSNQQQYGTSIIRPRGDHAFNRQFVIAHIKQIHFMLTEIFLPFFFIPKYYIHPDDEIPTMIVLKETIFILLLITTFKKENLDA